MAEPGLQPRLRPLHCSCPLRLPGTGAPGSRGGGRTCCLSGASILSPSLPEPNLGEDDEDKDLEPGPSGTSKVSAQISGQSDTDITAEFLQPLLTPDNVANLVRKGGGRSPQGGEEGSVVLFLPPLHTVTSAGGISPETLCSQWGGCGPGGPRTSSLTFTPSGSLVTTPCSLSLFFF